MYLALDSLAEIQPILLLLAALFSGVGWSFVAPARFATLPFYVNPKKLAGAAIALNLMVMTGFGLAPMLLKHIEVHYNWHTVLSFAVVLFIISSALLVPLHFHFKAKPTDKAWREVKQSLSFVKQSAFIKQLLCLSMIAYLLMGPMQVLLPSIARDNLLLSETQQGNYLSLIALALIVGGLLAMVLKRKGKLAKVMMGAIAIAGAGISYLGFENNLMLSIVTLAISSICGGIAISFIVAGLQAFSGNEHRGRVMSFYSIISQCIPAISGVGAGVLAQLYSPEIALQVIGVVIVLGVTICFVGMKKFSQLESFEHV